MRIAGKRVRKIRLVRTDQFVVAVEVEAVIPNADPSEACYKSETVELLREAERNARQGNVAWLKQHGKVNAAIGAG